MLLTLLALGFWLVAGSASAQFDGDELEFGEAEASEVQSTAMQYPHVSLAVALGVGILLLTVAFVAFALTRHARGAPFSFSLAQLPVSARVLATFFVLILGLVHIFALTEVYLQSKVTWSSAEEYFFYMKPTKLAATTHAHLFGHVTMYALVATLFLFTRLGETWKTLILSIAIAGGLWDVTSWWLIKYASAKFEMLSILSGAMAAVGFLTMVLLVLAEIWLPLRRTPEARRAS